MLQVGGRDWLSDQDAVPYLVEECPKELIQLALRGCPWSRVPERFSVRTVAALGEALPMRLALPHPEPFLARNPEKEIRKDNDHRLTARCA